ncbi:hypothetical protein [Amycolatopsis sp. NPDC058986]|uniref:hypothetical protein n=1 Tax=unclassified Amycolatopsis TaxID=2618356 RepID=UPI00367187FD
MPARQVGCGATLLLTAGEREFLEQLPDGANAVHMLHWCGLEPGHAGLHYTLAQHAFEDEWWLSWDITDHRVRDLRILAPCPVEGPPDPLGDTASCLLFLGHVGQHGFLFDVLDVPAKDRPPLLLPRVGEWTSLTRLQQDNHELLRKHGLTVQAYLRMNSLRLHERHLGEQSTRHLGLHTSLPVSQLAKVDATTPGLSAAVAQGLVDVVTHPAYEPLYDGDLLVDSIVVRLTAAGRELIDELDTLLQE